MGIHRIYQFVLASSADIGKGAKTVCNSGLSQTQGPHSQYLHNTPDNPLPPSSTVATAGRNHLNEEIIPPPPHWDRREILPNLIKFITCSALAPKVMN